MLIQQNMQLSRRHARSICPIFTCACQTTDATRRSRQNFPTRIWWEMMIPTPIIFNRASKYWITTLPIILHLDVLSVIKKNSSGFHSAWKNIKMSRVVSKISKIARESPIVSSVAITSCLAIVPRTAFSPLSCRQFTPSRLSSSFYSSTFKLLTTFLRSPCCSVVI